MSHIDIKGLMAYTYTVMSVEEDHIGRVAKDIGGVVTYTNL